MTYDELIDLLIERKALIVHCSRPGKGDEGIDGLLFPNDLKRAIAVCGSGCGDLSCSLIWPAHTKTFGAVGIILKPRATSSITSISPADAGTRYDPATCRRTGGGGPFSRQAVDETFAKANDYNEWTVLDAETVGIFISTEQPLEVAKEVQPKDIPGYDSSMGEMDPMVEPCSITVAAIQREFPDLPIYAFVQGELHRHGVGASEISDLYR
jgi:hypothetical protein